MLNFQRFALAALSLLCIQPAVADWPGFQGPNRDGVVPNAEIRTDWPDDGPPVRWSNDVGPGFGGASIVGDRVYILDRNDTVGDSLRVYDLATGEEQWSADYDAPGRISYHGSRGTPMVTGKFAFTVGSFGNVTCFDLEQQKVAWKQHMDDYGADPPKWAWSQTPLVYKNNVIISPMAGDAGLVALKQDTGQVIWKSDSIGIEGYSSPRLVTLAGKLQIVTFTSTLVSGVDPDTGEIIWTYDNIPVKRAIPTPAIVGDDKLFVTAGYDAGSALIQITRQGDAFAVKELKRDKRHGGQIHSALPVGQHLYVNLNTNENLRQRGKDAQGIGCFNTAGELLWKSDNNPDIDRGPVLALGEHLVTLGGEDGVLRLIEADANGYKEIASTKVFPADQRRNMIWAPMAFSNGLLIVRSQGELKCLDLSIPQAN
jgi:outer membrane protein assembly factor BamB